jgi:hypothetical protein
MLKAIAVFTLLACAGALADERAVIAEKGKDRFETEFAPGGRLQLEVRSGDVRISGTDSDQISIHYEGKNRSDIGEVEVRCKKLGSNAELSISGGPHNEFLIRIEVPRETELRVRMPFGALEIERVHGSKDVGIHAGQLTMEIGDPKDYARIEASVTTGALEAGVLGISKGGLFRSYTKDGPGKYKLYAHVGSGEIDLR